MPIALPARRADLKRFSRAIRSRSPRVVAMGPDYSAYSYTWWLTIRTKCSYRGLRPGHDSGRHDVAGTDRPAAGAAATPGVTVDEAAHARFAATLVAGRAGAGDRRGIGPWHHLQRRHREDSSPRHLRPVALRRRTRQTLHSQHPSRRYARTRTARRLVVPERTAAGLGRQCQALCRDRWRRRAHPAPPTPLAARIER